MVITIDIDDILMEEIEAYQKENHIKARTEAIRRLLWWGLDNDKTN